MSDSNKTSRYIPQEINEAVKKASGFNCAWCGVSITERHHIIPFCSAHEHTADNLILLCPNCHTEATSGKISRGELVKRRCELTGEINRSSGSLSIGQGDYQIDVGGNHFINCRNIFMFNEDSLIAVENENGCLLITMKIFNESGNLVCWMSRNRWWVEGSTIKDFQHSKNNLRIIDQNGDSILHLSINNNLININGYLYIKGNKILFSSDRIEFGSGIKCVNNTFNLENAIVFSDNPSLVIGAGIRLTI